MHIIVAAPGSYLLMIVSPAGPELLVGRCIERSLHGELHLDRDLGDHADAELTQMDIN